jgi:hypothetical protein
MQASLRFERTACGGYSTLLVRMSIVALIFAGSPAFAQTNTTSISGIVVDDSGAPAAVAMVHYNNSPATAKDAAGHILVAGPFVSYHVSTASDGTFSITALPAGTYSLYAAGASQTQLRSCDWGQGSTTVPAGATNVKLQVTNGVLLTFQVSDPRGQIEDFPAATVAGGEAPPRGNFRIFVRDGNSIFMAAASPVSVNGAVRQYSVAVPKARTLRLFLDTSLKVVDQSQTAVTARGVASQIAINGQPVTVQLTLP